jgi:hypothetical protein
VTGTRTSNGEVEADLVIDALGRTSPVFYWLQALGAAAPQMETSPCGQIYYSRYFQLKANAAVPTRGWLISPRGDLGYGGFMTFIADNRTFAIVLTIPVSDAKLKILQHEPAFISGVPAHTYHRRSGRSLFCRANQSGPADGRPVEHAL